MNKIVLVAHNLRSCHNVGSILRTADGLGVEQVILSGYTPYPRKTQDKRLPHEADQVHRRIHKTALGAEDQMHWEQTDSIDSAIENLRQQGYQIFALEQTENSTPLPSFDPPGRLAIIVGREVEGLEPEVVAKCDGALEIPMQGQKESFNVAQASAMALYHVTFS